MIRMTRECTGGIIGGLGLGILAARWLTYEGLDIGNARLMLVWFALIAIGGYLARSAQKQRVKADTGATQR